VRRWNGAVRRRACTGSFVRTAMACYVWLDSCTVFPGVRSRQHAVSPTPRKVRRLTSLPVERPCQTVARGISETPGSHRRTRTGAAPDAGLARRRHGQALPLSALLTTTGLLELSAADRSAPSGERVPIPHAEEPEHN